MVFVLAATIFFEFQMLQIDFWVQMHTAHLCKKKKDTVKQVHR